MKVWDKMGGALLVFGEMWPGAGARAAPPGLGGRTEWIRQEFWQGVGAVLDRDPRGVPGDTPGALSGISEWELSVLALDLGVLGKGSVRFPFFPGEPCPLPAAEAAAPGATSPRSSPFPTLSRALRRQGRASPRGSLPALSLDLAVFPWNPAPEENSDFPGSFQIVLGSRVT